jgi:Xaa-Pro dipeptidase
MFQLDRVQAAIAEENVDGWLLYDFQGSDPLARRILNVGTEGHLTRRWFYYVPKTGKPKKLVHKIEPAALDKLPGERVFYAGWREMESRLREIVSGSKKIAMDYSPGNAIPYVSRVDAGTMELVRKSGVEVLTAADLIQEFEAVMTDAQLETHVRAAKLLRTIVDETFEYVAKGFSTSKKLTEYDVQQFIVKQFEDEKMVWDSDPIVAVNANAANPHYAPTKTVFQPIQKGDFLLIDLWAKEKTKDAVYADITWTGYLGSEIPEKYVSVFEIIRDARDAGLRFVTEAARAKRRIKGAEVDDVVRGHIASKGFGDAFIHRTGHNIGQEVHGNGANIDNFETREERKLLPGTCFSIEPGIYLPEFGVRTEIDVVLTDKDAIVFGQPIQTKLIPILS